MSKLVVILGPQAVGKMTVGQELAKITGLRLFHNHMTIDLVSKIFPMSTPTGWDLICKFRRDIFEAVAKSELEGIIFTFIWDFDNPAWKGYFDDLIDLYEQHNGEVYFVELEADLEQRIIRNKSENRLLHKPSKRNFGESEANLFDWADKLRMNTKDGEIYHKNWLKICNTNISAGEAAEMIREKFDL